MEWIGYGALGALILYLIGVYNGLVGLRARVGQAYADVDVQLKQRHDLIPNLVETVKAYAAHERGTFDAVVKARNEAITAKGTGAQAGAEATLSGSIGRLMALAEAYPDLKADENFRQLQTDLAETEDNLAAARRFFNNAVQEYNASLQSFPAVLFSSALGFTQREFFDLGESERQRLDVAPQVKF
ncbi:MAG TPA: LemA family protein [Microvirga sp.]|jgi:LemA protein|nr:LemA family protein [Microvirga sp.]